MANHHLDTWGRFLKKITKLIRLMIEIKDYRHGYWANSSGLLDGVKKKCLMSNTLLELDVYCLHTSGP